MKRLSANFNNYQKFSIRQLEEMIKQTQQKHLQEKAEYERAAKEYEANKSLLERMAVKQREFENSEANFRKAESRIREQENRLVELKNSLEAVKSGVFLGDGHNDVPYSSQRMDQLVIDSSQAKTAMKEAADRIIGIEQQIATERERIEKARSYAFSAPYDSLIWRLPYSEGSSVAIGSELVTLLDCSNIFLDIVIAESQFPDIKPGDSIQYRLIGESTYHNGKVFALRGSGRNIADVNLATNIGKDPRREFHIRAYPAPGSLDLKPENFFQVGRRIEVKLPRSWHPGREINRFFNVF